MRTHQPAWLFGVLAIVATTLNLFVVNVCADNVTNPVSIYYSRPDLFAAPILTVVQKEEDVSPGYYFVTPYQADNPGPYIYDSDGNLVWSGFGNSGPAVAHNLQVCEYEGTDHLCFFQGNQMLGYGRGHGVIMDNQYRIVKSVQPGGGMAGSDMHEFRLIEGGKRALLTVYQQRPYDLTAYNIKTGTGWIFDCVFQEINVSTGEVVFEWHSLDHIHPKESYVLPATTETSGNGLIPNSPWDYFHINSIDKNADEDYIISARHVSAVYKISGKDGSVLWRLNGAKSSFRMVNFENEYSFSHQHDARFVKETETTTVISLFNNGSNGKNETVPNSTGQIIVLDHVANTATLVKSYGAPDGGMLSASQGNMQILDDGHVVIGWGVHAFLSEHREDGTPVFWAYLATFGVMHYRAFKFQWDASPVDIPAIFSYAQNSNGRTFFYASWNGATRVKAWRFYTSAAHTGPFKLLKEVPKKGFETVYSNHGFHGWAFVEAVAEDGTGIANSSIGITYVPSPELEPYCTNAHCPLAQGFGFPEDNPDGDKQENPAPDDQQEEAEPEEQEQQTQAEAFAAEEEFSAWKWVWKLTFLMALIGGVYYLVRRYPERFASPSPLQFP
ncbi:MAG: hypothetical protein M1834_003085 [Cirrosporium novae-zelandiae]|nr:MAG: hypothetical protein M1834_003085 [Cirrosporium novae-zelandiae]